MSAGVDAGAETRCAATEARDLARAEEALVPEGLLAGARLVVAEPEARPARGFLRAAAEAFRAAGGDSRVVPSGFYAGAPRAPEPYAAAWELDEIARSAARGFRSADDAAAAPLCLEPRGAPRATVAAEGWLCHSFAGRRAHDRPEVAAVVPASARRILELGCAGGDLGEALERRGARVTGIEADPECARRAASRISRVVAAPVEEAWPEAGEGWDAIVLADVLEHLEEPVEVLRELARRAAPEAVLVASVPNATHASVLAGVLQGRWDRALEGIVCYAHRTYAGRAGWLRLLAAGGWVPERVEPLSLETPRSALWRDALHAAGLAPEETLAGQWLVLARKASARADLPLGPSEALSRRVEDPLAFASESLARGEIVEFPSALTPEAVEALFSGEVACGAARRALASGHAAEALERRLAAAGISVRPAAVRAPAGRFARALEAARRGNLPAGDGALCDTLRAERAR